MAGHSKWANIKHQKARNDAKRGKIFTKLIRDIITAAKHGGGNINDNPSLRLAVDNARKENMTKDTIERAIKRGTGEIQGDDYVEKTYEGYGPAGVAVIVKTLTDNTTRTVTSVRTAFNKNGGNMGNDGAVAWMFEEKGIIVYPDSVGDEEAVMEAAIEGGAEDFEAEDGIYKITTAVADFGAVRDALAEKFDKADVAELSYIPTQTQEISELDAAKSVMKLISALEEDDDVQDVTSNMDIDDTLAEQLVG